MASLHCYKLNRKEWRHLLRVSGFSICLMLNLESLAAAGFSISYYSENNIRYIGTVKFFVICYTVDNVEYSWAQ